MFTGLAYLAAKELVHSPLIRRDVFPKYARSHGLYGLPSPSTKHFLKANGVAKSEIRKRHLRSFLDQDQTRRKGERLGNQGLVLIIIIIYWTLETKHEFISHHRYVPFDRMIS